MATHLPVIPDTYLWTVNYTIGTAPMANVLCFSKPSTNAAGINSSVWTNWIATNSYRQLQSNQVLYHTTVCLPLDGSGLADIQDRTGVTGAVNTPPVPPNSCGIITFRTGTRGRSFRGRMYLGGIVNTNLGTPATLWSTTAVTAMNTANTTFLNGNVAAGITHEVLSRKLGVATPVLQYVSRNYIGSQRDRSESQIP